VCEGGKKVGKGKRGGWVKGDAGGFGVARFDKRDGSKLAWHQQQHRAHVEKGMIDRLLWSERGCHALGVVGEGRVAQRKGKASCRPQCTPRHTQMHRHRPPPSSLLVIPTILSSSTYLPIPPRPRA